MHLRRHSFLFRKALPNPPSISSIPCSIRPVFYTSSLPASQRRTCSQSYKPFKLPENIRSRAIHSTSEEPDSKSSQSTKMGGDTYSSIFDSNSKWSRSLGESHPELFSKLGKGQAPEILWIGCADSRCPETTILGLQPGDIFCHRNIANILTNTDLNSLSVIQYAVQYLKVNHIIVCGHTSCGGVAAALDNKALGLIDTWLQPLRLIRQRNLKTIMALPESERNFKLVDLNVRNSITTLLENPVVIQAIGERDLKVHGLVYNVGSGELKELDITEESQDAEDRIAAFKTS